MTGCRGFCTGTRNLFSFSEKNHGYILLSAYLRTYKMGDYVDINVNGTAQYGMPYKIYQGRTGVVWNITKRAVGVEIHIHLSNNN